MDNNKPFTSMSGVAKETAEPAEATTPAPQAPNRGGPPLSSSSLRDSQTKRLQAKRATSANNSPLPSRESSPVRPSLKSVTARSAGPGRSRKNSANDVSPSRSASANTNPPSAAAQQRALSAASIPKLQPAVFDPSSIHSQVAQKLSVTSELKDTPRWPVSPRLRSPPPSNNKFSITSPKKFEQDPPAINLQRPASEPTEQKDGKQPTVDSDLEDNLAVPGMRTPARGTSAGSSTLETVQEISQPGTPANGLDGALERKADGTMGPPPELDPMDVAFGKPSKPKPANESGSESGGKGEIKMKPAAAPITRANAPATKYSANTAAGRGKPSGEGSIRTMTVETETVSSIPQVALGGGVGVGNNGTLRAKPSSETIRPKKEKKKITRKTPSVASGTGEPQFSSRPKPHHHHSTREDSSGTSFYANQRSPDRQFSHGASFYGGTGETSPPRPHSSMSQLSRKTSVNLYSVGSTMLTRPRPASSKADIFEAKVASAVDEANSSDSEETFVYESNPPEQNDRPRRFHSRTPSATSMASQADLRNGARSVLEGGHSVAMKKSMKFANSYSTNNNTPEMATEDDGKGTVRSNIGTGRGNSHHHHIGRWGRNGGNGHPSLFDNESPFPNAAKSKLAANNNRHSSQPTSPRVMSARMVGNGNGKKSPILPYDTEDAADDERTPLIPSLRSGRSGRNRRPASSSMRQLEHQASRYERSFISRFAGCLVLALMILLVLIASVAFAFATTQPLSDMKITALKNVLASEQDVMLDIRVEARNPNVVAVAIDSTDLVIFAKSKYAGTDAEWYKDPHPPVYDDIIRWGTRKRDDDPEDPPLEGTPSTSPNLEIGHVLFLDSPLTFEASPFQSTRSSSTAQIRIVQPGNNTLPAGSERWGRVLQHDFDLIVRGTLKYTLPFSQRYRSVSVEGRITVKPNAADSDPDTVHI